jgi:hypothetical protein
MSIAKNENEQLDDADDDRHQSDFENEREERLHCLNSHANARRR